MGTTLLLDQTTWDLCLDAYGNIAVASEPYAIAQDVACAVRAFRGECWYDTSVGVPYWQDILGKRPQLQLIKKDIVTEARRVKGVQAAQCFITSMKDRVVTGQVQVATATDVLPVNF
ncbi:hypothetical protein KDW82_06040 [Burkholderia vietnamiensis]|uniref:hypothetical protein n=1 Tax=Burkholderia vietnamiensis TaxID=60552 RepID=UPI001B9D4725|nr:hypothetical protein [Burkholderia vietnamiensis]MBR8188621.1 hypothetical protein [Burkholderia vietnamiensis]HDR9087374.1 hypothetical protein [Burkholderia vietnamiensis]